jgi:two-component system response regulator QseB
MPGLRALVADDDPEMLEMVASALTRELGADVTRAENGDELLGQLADDDSFDVIVTDISMPWMTGLQVMHSARTAGHPIPVVVMTALRDPSIAEQVGNLGDQARLIRKPFMLADLMRALHEVLPAVPMGAASAPARTKRP